MGHDCAAGGKDECGAREEQGQMRFHVFSPLLKQKMKTTDDVIVSR
jgi:hypothetical protein